MINGALAIQKIASTVNEAGPELQKLKKATDSLEAFMFKSLLQSMGGKKGLFGSTVPGGEIYKDMMEQSLSDIMATRGTLNIGNTIFQKVAPLALSQIQAQKVYQPKVSTNLIEKKA
jgi:Rod binding domain-containing protein